MEFCQVFFILFKMIKAKTFVIMLSNVNPLQCLHSRRTVVSFLSNCYDQFFFDDILMLQMVSPGGVLTFPDSLFFNFLYFEVLLLRCSILHVYFSSISSMLLHSKYFIHLYSCFCFVERIWPFASLIGCVLEKLSMTFLMNWNILSIFLRSATVSASMIMLLWSLWLTPIWHGSTTLVSCIRFSENV